MAFVTKANYAFGDGDGAQDDLLVGVVRASNNDDSVVE